jgi:anthranilate synthase component II
MTRAPGTVGGPIDDGAGGQPEPEGRAARVLLLDNYDSFTYNLYQALVTLGADVRVARNDEISVEDVEAFAPDGIVISPGPSRPERAGISVELIRRLGPTTPTLGVCLGHQAIGVAYGAEVVRVEPVHGKRSPVLHEEGASFAGLASPMQAARYHSLAVERGSIPPELEVTAWSPDGLVMGMRHRVHPVEGVQFHPESILTDEGVAFLRTWLGSLGR